MGFDFNNKENEDTPASCLLSKVTIITPEHHELFQSLKLEYDSTNITTSIYVKAATTIVNSILTQERFYFAFSRRSLVHLFEKDLNLKEFQPGTFNGETWNTILHKCYTSFGIMSPYQLGKGKRASMYRIENQEIANFLLAKGIDSTKQKEETLAFITTDFTKVTKK